MAANAPASRARSIKLQSIMIKRKQLLAVIAATTIAIGGAALAAAPAATADQVAYLVNVHVRPGYNFPNAEQALAYGYGICDKIAQGEGYPQLMVEVKADFNTSDEYQGSYLISQAAQELCPALIWQLRNSAVHYAPLPG
jgi:hypothetical protein